MTVNLKSEVIKMREVWFRGKVKLPINYRGYNLSHRNGDWVYGLMNSNGSIRGIFVDTNTIGQYTGLTDKNGTKIFEDDILQVSYHGDEIGRVCIYFKYAMYLCDVIYGDIDFDTLGMLNANYQLEVIGNAYDNPELLNAKE